MKRSNRLFSLRWTSALAILVISLSACAPAVPGAAGPATQTQAVIPTDLPLPTQPPPPTSTPAPTSMPTPPPPASNLITYQDETAGFELDYPDGWTLKPKTVLGSRGSQAHSHNHSTKR